MKTVINAGIWWGGIIAYSIYFKKTHPDAGFFASLFDLWMFAALIGLSILQAIVNKLFFKD